MGLIDRLRRVGGIVKNRIASAVGTLRGTVAGVTVRGARTVRGVRFAARATRLLTPAGIGLTAVSFAPEILRGLRSARRIIAPAIARGIAFFGGRQLATAAGAGAVAGTLSSRRKGGVSRPSDFGDPRLQTRRPSPNRRPTIRNGVRATRARPTRRAGRRTTARRRRARIPAHGHRVISVSRRSTRGKRKRRTHASPRHRGHKRVSFTTASGKKVSFLTNPKARHR